jgi:hypothetical protein
VAYDEKLADRVRGALADEPSLEERKMFGGIAFMVDGHMCVGIVGAELMVRLGPEGTQDALGRPHVREMDFTGRPSRNMVFVRPPGLRTAAALRGWIDRARAFVRTLPAREGGTRRRSGRTRAPGRGW